MMIGLHPLRGGARAPQEPEELFQVSLGPGDAGDVDVLEAHGAKLVPAGNSNHKDRIESSSDDHNHTKYDNN